MRQHDAMLRDEMAGAAVEANGGSQDLTRIPFLRGLSPEMARRYAGAARWFALEPGQEVIGFEEVSDDVFFVLTGSVRIAVRTSGGQELILDDIPAGQFFGEMAAIDGAPRSASVTALYRSSICRIQGAAFMALLADSPLLARQMMRLLVGRIRLQNARLLERTAFDVGQRLQAELLRLAGPPAADGTRTISPPPVQQVIAQRIGARREAVSREMARLLREGILLRRRGALVLCHPALLERAVAEALES